MKKIYTVLLACLMMAGALPALADESGSCGTSVTYSYNSATKTLTISGSGAMKDFWGDSYSSSYRAPWYFYRTEIEKVAINNGVTSIGNYAFYNCTNLQGFIDVNSSSTTVNNTTVTSIGDYAFYNCDHLEMTLDLDYLFSGLQTIGNYAFAECDGLTRFQHGTALTTIGSNAFENCTNMASAVIGSSVTTIGNSAFKGCQTIPLITIPSSVTSLGNEVFANCNLLKTVIFEDGTKTISFGYDNRGAFSSTPIETLTINRPLTISNSSYQPFAGKTSIKTVTIGRIPIIDGTGMLPDYLFRGCTGLTSVTLPANISDFTAIGAYTFEGCSALPSITIPNTVTTIGNSAFKGCQTFSSITFPSSVTYINSEAFANCNLLKTVTFEDGTSTISFDYYNRNAFSSTPIETLTINRPLTISNSSYQPFAGKTSIKTITISRIPIIDGTGKLPDYLFRGCTGLTSVTLPANISDFTAIGAYTFEGCSALPSITIPNTVTSIGNSAFKGCQTFSSITFPSSVTSIGSEAFANCNLLKTVTFEDGTSTISFDYNNNNAFSSTPIETLTINRPLTTYNGNSYQPFAGKTSIKTVTIGNQANNVSNYLFYNCTALQSITNNAATPQTINANVFTGVDKANCILKVPAASLSQYKAKDVWKEFFVQGVAGNCNNVGDVLSGNSSLGSAVVLKYVSNDVAEIAALPKAGSVFVQWNDGNTQNPRTVSLCNTNFTAQFATCSSSGIESVQSASAIQIYPNPVKDELFINSDTPVGNVEIYDMSGRQVVNGKLSNGQSLHVSHLTAGIYLVKAGNYTAKFVKE